ncbi:energy transducer TonB [Labilibaculum sp.]|uniref:energy transducer TonB n=1 Tax=Labilibaculum sp. TaxID=2060723 RepID=UPI002AA861F9|nr:energy transducer TonB [Labilibaculum sp.]MBN2596462.1 energy transducer TonB [Marinifilaceae bacterium]
MNKIILIVFLIFSGFQLCAQSENSGEAEEVVEINLGNLIIQTIPSELIIEIPKLGIDGNKIQDSIILEEINTGVYDITFILKKKKFKCSVEVLNQKTTHLMVDVKEKKSESKEIQYIPHLPDPIPVPVNTGEVYVIVDDMPEFPGGNLELQRYIAMSVRYPIEAQQKGITGRVFVTFVINKDGRAVGVRIIRSADPLLDAEAIRVVRCMPEWKPGRQEGELVNVSYTIPITFYLQ